MENLSERSFCPDVIGNLEEHRSPIINCSGYDNSTMKHRSCRIFKTKTREEREKSEPEKFTDDRLTDLYLISRSGRKNCLATVTV